MSDAGPTEDKPAKWPRRVGRCHYVSVPVLSDQGPFLVGRPVKSCLECGSPAPEDIDYCEDCWSDLQGSYVDP